jgi:hypothetical protein
MKPLNELTDEEIKVLIEKDSNGEPIEPVHSLHLWREFEKRNLVPIYFHFYDLVTETDYRIALSCTADVWNEWEEQEVLTGTFISRLEGEYGVHDIHGTMNKERLLVGFNSYEIEGGEWEIVLSQWKEKLMELGWVHANQSWTVLQIPQNEV